MATCNAPYNGCRNNAIGAVAAHVFENTGTFTVTLTVFDGTNTFTKTQDITVTAFSGKTYCIHNSVPLGSGVCSGVEHATTGDFKTDVANAIAAGAKQILFKRGDTFTTTSGATISTAGPGIVGSYGPGAIPVINTTSTVTYNNIINFSGSANDWRLMDLDIEGTGANKQYAVGFYRDFLTALRVTTGKVRSAFDTNSGSVSVYTDSLTVQDSTVANPGADTEYGWYCGTCSHAAALGNSMFLGTTATSGHDIRFQGAHYFVIANSDQIGATAKPGAINGFTIRGDSQYGEIVDNNIISFNAQIMPQNRTSNENQRDIVVERNFFTAAQLQIQANNITVRNNVFNLTGYTNVNYNSPQAVAVGWSSNVGSPMPTNLYIYNNSTYYGDTCNAGDSCSGVAFGSGISGCVATVKNNLTYIPNGTSQFSVWDNTSGGCSITGASGTYGNSSDIQVKSVSPMWSNGSSAFSTTGDFKPTGTSYAIGSNNSCAGAPCSVSDAPVIADFFGNLRTSTYDTGAVNH